MASSLGYAMMNWTSEFARHAKAKRNKKKHSKKKENSDGNKINSQTNTNFSEIKHKSSTSALAESSYFEKNEVEVQTEGRPKRV